MSNSEKRKYTYFVTGGGTGGHIYPAVAVADALINDETTKDLYYIGNPKNLEYEIIKNKGYKFLGVNVHGMPRQMGFEFVKWVFQLGIAILKCCYYSLRYKPDVVFGTGGYVSAPALLSCFALIRGKSKTIPFMLHDCDAQPGLVTRHLAQHAACISVAFDCAKDILKSNKIEVNGNPIRSGFKTLTKDEARKMLGLGNKLTLCVMGGSQGAKSINNATIEILKTLSQEYNMQIIFQTGKKNFDKVIEQLINVYPEYENDKNLIIKPYFEDMVSVLKASEIAVARSGSLSISEICASGIAPVFVPYPYAAANHQRKNAEYMVEKDAGLYIEDSEVTPESLLKMLVSLIDNPLRLAQIKANSLKLAKYDGAEKIMSQLKSIAENQK